METNIDNESFTEEMNADLKSASEADTLPMDAKASGPATVALKTTSQVSMHFTAIKYLDIYLCLVLLQVPKCFELVQIFCAQNKNLFKYCGSHKHFVPDKKMICIQ